MHGLRLVSRIKSRDSFDFDNQFAVYHKICNVFTNQFTLINYRERNLLLEANISGMQLMSQGFLIDCLQKAGAKQPVNFHGSTNDSKRQLFIKQLSHGTSKTNKKQSVKIRAIRG